MSKKLFDDLNPETARKLAAILIEYAEDTEKNSDRLSELSKRLRMLSPWLYSQCFGVLDNKIQRQGCQDVLEAAVIVSKYAELIKK